MRAIDPTGRQGAILAVFLLAFAVFAVLSDMWWSR
jgi:hypothetical protein